MRILKFKMVVNKSLSFAISRVPLLLLNFMLISSSVKAQDKKFDTLLSDSPKKENQHKENAFRMTTLTFGGNGAYFTKVNNQFTVLSGGRGAATFNHRYTIGGGGWGMIKGVEVESSEPGTYDFLKMGYGGLEFGYIIYPGEKLFFGSNLMVAGGAIFKESVPKSDEKEFKMFPVLEPSLYSQIAMGKMFRLEIGVTYRYIYATKLSYISNNNLSGFSCYIGFLVKACKCD